MEGKILQIIGSPKISRHDHEDFLHPSGAKKNARGTKMLVCVCVCVFVFVFVFVCALAASYIY